MRCEGFLYLKNMLTLLDQISLIRNQIISDIKSRYVKYISAMKGTRNFRQYNIRIDWDFKVELPPDIVINTKELESLYLDVICNELGGLTVYDTVEGRNKSMETIPIEHMVYILSYIEQKFLS